MINQEYRNIRPGSFKARKAREAVRKEVVALGASLVLTLSIVGVLGWII